MILGLNSVSGVQYKDMMIDRWWKVSTGIIDVVISQIRYLLVVILGLNSVSGVQYKDIMIDRWWKVSTEIIDVWGLALRHRGIYTKE